MADQKRETRRKTPNKQNANDSEPTPEPSLDLAFGQMQCFHSVIESTKCVIEKIDTNKKKYQEGQIGRAELEHLEDVGKSALEIFELLQDLNSRNKSRSSVFLQSVCVLAIQKELSSQMDVVEQIVDSMSKKTSPKRQKTKAEKE